MAEEAAVPETESTDDQHSASEAPAADPLAETSIEAV